MLLIIHNLPLNTRYTDVKEMIKDKCGLTEMIIDNLVTEGKSKKVTVGLADEGDAAILVRKINGLYVCNQQLYVEDVRQKKNTEQPYRPGPMSKQHDQEQFNQVAPPPFDNQYYGQQGEMQFQPPPFMPMESQLPPGPPQPNFGVPFYMTSQNQNVGNDHQFMVQYPKVQGPMVNEPYEGRDMGFDQQYGGRQTDQTMSPDRGPYRRRSPKRSSRWNEPGDNRLDSRRGRDRPDQRDDRHDADSYRGNRDSFKSRSNQDYGSNKPSNNRFEKPFNRSNDPKWERPDRSTFREQNEPHRSNDNRNFNTQDRRFNQEGEPQRFRENNNSQSRGFDFESRPSDLSKKRPYESSDKNKFGPPNKKFGSNKQRNFNQQGASGSPFSKNYQNKNNSYSTKSPARGPMQQNKPYMQSKGPQKAKAPWKQDNQSQANQKPTPEMLARHEAWRVQASSCIATEILKNVGKPRNKRDPIIIALKACVRARIDVVVGDNMSLTLREILYNYRDKFQDDDAFYKTVCEKVAKGELDEFGTGKKESEDVAAKTKQETKPKLQFVGKPPATAPSSGSTDRLPKYPAGDKKVLSQLKQAQKEEMLNDDLYNLDPEHEKALKEELDKLEELIKQQYENPENETEKSISKFMNDVFVPDLRKILTLHVKKRVLDVRTNLSVRVICQYKAPKRDLLDAFLKDYGVVSLKASDKNRNVMVAICDSYENFDALCKQESTVINDLKISFKPLHITGPPLKGKFKKQVNIAKNAVTEKNKQHDNIATVNKNESSNDNGEVNDGNEEMASEVNEDKQTIDEQENKINEDSECEIISSNKSEDVIVLEDNLNSKDVIVIDDHDAKVTADDEQVIDEASTSAADSKVAIDNEEPTMNKESVTVDGNEAAITGGSEIMEQDVPELIDADKIADDDLEDF